MSELHAHVDVQFKPTPGGKLLNASATESYRAGARETVSKILPRAGNVPSSILQSSTAQDIYFDIEPLADEVNSIQLVFTLNNADGANAMNTVDAFSLIDQIDVMCEGQLVQQLYGYSMRANYILSDDVQKLATGLAAAGISSSTFASNVAIAASSSQTFLVPINSIINEFPLYMGYRWQLVIRLRGGAGIMMAADAAGNGDLTISDVYLLADGIVLSPEVKVKTMQMLQGLGPVNYKYLNSVREVIPIGSVTSGNAVSANFKTAGRVSNVWLHYHATTATNETLAYTPSTVTAFELLQNGKVLDHNMPDNGYTWALRKAIQGPSCYKTSLPLTQLNLYNITASDQPTRAVETGADYGSFVCRGQSEQIRVLPSANATVQLDCYAMVFAEMEIDFGRRHLSIQKGL